MASRDALPLEPVQAELDQLRIEARDDAGLARGDVELLAPHGRMLFRGVSPSALARCDLPPTREVPPSCREPNAGVSPLLESQIPSRSG
jgi:hypothetical protein